MLILGERRLPTMMGVKGIFGIEGDGDDDDDDDDDGAEWIIVGVYQIQKFRFALSVQSDLVDEECKLTSSVIVVEVMLRNFVWAEGGNNLMVLFNPPSSRTLVDIDISIIPKRGEEYSPHIEGERHHILATRSNKDYMASLWEHQPNDLPRFVHGYGFRFYCPFTGDLDAGLARFEAQVRLTMAILHECFKRIESFPDETSYPSVECLMRELPEPFHRYFPKEFDDRERLCRDRDICFEFGYRRARSRREWREEWRRVAAGRPENWMEEYDLNGPRSIPWYRDDYNHFLMLHDESSEDEEDVVDEEQEGYDDDEEDDDEDEEE
jgi:hypothetical protein